LTAAASRPRQAQIRKTAAISGMSDPHLSTMNRQEFIVAISRIHA
jgi:hypothetical protein